MPDLKTALALALARSNEQEALKDTLDAWEEDEQRIRTNQTTQPQQEKTLANPNPNPNFSITNNVMRVTFNHIRDNKNQDRKSVIAALTQRGFKESSISAVISQLMRSQQVYKHADSTLQAVVKEYVPIKQSKRPKHPPAQISDKLKQQISVMKRKAATKQGIAALKADSGELELKPVAKTWTPDDVVNKLNVVQARQLYDYLKNLFGG